jgi:hypothetical protein
MRRRIDIKVITTQDGKVAIGSKDEGLFVVSPWLARELARDLLVKADEAEGERPSHVYQVQAATF